jgi:polar amino acid transport system ATP-binding protein/sulfate transport system ATP-binding protein
MMLIQPHERGEVLLKVANVSLTLGGRLILRDVSLEGRDLIRPGSATGRVGTVLGASGSGGSRLFRIMAGLDKPDEGIVLIGAAGEPVARGSVGVVFQHYPLFEHRSILGNVVLAARRGGLRGQEARDRALQILERLGLKEDTRKYPAQLSGGQRQRVAIAQQILCSKHFLLMDEPFSGLDPIATEQVCELIAEVAGLHEFNTIVVVTHNIDAGLEVADTVHLLGRDRLANGAPVPGARIQMTIDMIARGLAWRKGIQSTPEFFDVTREIREKFYTL